MWRILILFCLFLCVFNLEISDAGERTNFVIFLCDDLGYGDLGCFGNEEVKTPNLDRLAGEGMRLTDCYAAAANCSPSRAGLMTGITPNRLGIYSWIPDESPMHLKRSEITVATLLRDAGYATCQVGKWHLSGMFYKPSDQPTPKDHGFDYWFSTQNNALPNHMNPDNFLRNGEAVGKLKGVSSELVANEAIHWLEQVRDKNKPFFLHVCFHEPHEPIATAKRFEDLYDYEDSRKVRYHGNISQMDHAVGRILKKLDDGKLRENTFVIFTSDNGPAITSYHPFGSAGPLRGKKGMVYEGGIRVPGIIRWPGKTKPGEVCKEPVIGTDILPTFCEIANIAEKIPYERNLDGASFLPIFAGKEVKRKRPLYWQFNYATTAQKVAMRIGDDKILGGLTGPNLRPTSDITAENQSAIKNGELDQLEIYHLGGDIAEAENLVEKHEKIQEFIKTFKTHYETVNKQVIEWPVWKSPRNESKRIIWVEKRRPVKKK